MKKPINEILMEHLRRKYETHTVAAACFGISRQHLSKIVNGHVPPTQKILDELGYEKTTETTTSYRKVKK